MSEKPILFSTPMVKLLLNAKPDVWPPEPIDDKKPFKWQTRRVVKPQPEIYTRYETAVIEAGKLKIYGRGIGDIWETRRIYKVPYKVGDILYVRETWQKVDNNYIYLADYQNGIQPCAMRPSIHMKKEISRLFLVVKNIRVERLQNISQADAVAEGINKCWPTRTDTDCERCRSGTPAFFCKDFAVRCFRAVWHSLYSNLGYSWESNSYVFVYEFMRRSKP